MLYQLKIINIYCIVVFLYIMRCLQSQSCEVQTPSPSPSNIMSPTRLPFVSNLYYRNFTNPDVLEVNEQGFTFKHLFNMDVRQIKELLLAEGESSWSFFEYPDAKNVAKTKHTRSIPLYYSFNHWSRGEHLKRFYFPQFLDKYMPHLENVIEYLKEKYPHREITKMIFINLLPMKDITLHEDKPDALKFPLRVHIPIITNPACYFKIGNDEKIIPEGVATIINHRIPHAVYNNHPTEGRIHLLIDLMPKEYIPSIEDIDDLQELLKTAHEYIYSLQLKDPNFIVQG